ncbi:MAG: hypothetical protein IJ764_01625 [Bacteroidales bacterium]|nr:hypothetical protein [Bacteroidales bacterium]
MARNQNKSRNVNYGICTNTGGKADGTPCSKCQNKEKQAISARKDFVCEECCEPLTKTTPPSAPVNVKLIVAIVAAVALIAGGIFLFSGRGEADENLPLADTTVVDSATPEPIQEPAEEAKTGEKNGGDDKSHKTSQAPSIDILKYASYDGDYKNGVPHGNGGTLKFKKAYRLDLKTSNGDFLDINAGETIKNTRFRDGRLCGGNLYRNNGEQKSFSR